MHLITVIGNWYYTTMYIIDFITMIIVWRLALTSFHFYELRFSCEYIKIIYFLNAATN